MTLLKLINYGAYIFIFLGLFDAFYPLVLYFLKKREKLPTIYDTLKNFIKIDDDPKIPTLKYMGLLAVFCGYAVIGIDSYIGLHSMILYVAGAIIAYIIVISSTWWLKPLLVKILYKR